jgi:putative flippase GtrA
MMLASVAKYRRFFAFAAVGGASTVVHAGVVIGLVEFFGLLPTIANLLAFLAANVFSYLANGKVTFGKPLSFAGYGRFLVVSLTTLATVVGLAGAGDALKVNYLVSLAIVLTVAPVISYALMSRFAFR